MDGEISSSRVVAEDISQHEEKAKHLDAVLTQVFDLLSGDPAEEWAELFHNSELSRVRNEIYQLRARLRETILGDGIA